MPEPADELLVTRQSLLNRLKDWGDDESWKDFFNIYWRLIYSVAIKAGLSDAEAQDAVQETVITVAKNIREFHYDRKAGSFKGWLFHIARWRITDQFRKRQRAPAKSRDATARRSRTATIERIPDPASVNIDDTWDEEWQKNMLAAALERVKRKVSPTLFQIYDCYVVKEWPVKEVTRAFRINVGQVYLAKHRVSALIKKQIRFLETKLV